MISIKAAWKVGGMEIAAFLDRFDALPTGSFRATYEGRAYVVCKQALAGGRAQKLVAEELGGGDYISLNLYRLEAGALLKPCEMPEEKVVDFVMGLVV